jgi:hypothetical protein
LFYKISEALLVVKILQVKNYIQGFRLKDGTAEFLAADPDV